MDKVIKPDRLSLDPDSPQASKQWKHWIKTVENYFEALAEIRGEGTAANKLRILISLVDFKVFDFIEDCDTKIVIRRCNRPAEEHVCKST